MIASIRKQILEWLPRCWSKARTAVGSLRRNFVTLAFGVVALCVISNSGICQPQPNEVAQCM
jgi:hypothetical protein